MTDDLPRVLLLGNSHIGALRLAHASDPERWPDWDVYFLGVLAGSLGQLDLRDGVLVPTTPAAQSQMKYYNHVNRLDVSGFDAFAICGGVSWIRAASICADHRSLDFPSVIAGDESCQIVSRDFLQTALQQRLAGSSAGRILSRLGVLGKPVMMAPEPMLSVDGAADHDRYADYNDLVERGDLAHWRGLYAQAAARSFGLGATVIGWPEPALERAAYTRHELMRGSRRLGVEDAAHPEDDYEHANADYGLLVMDQIMQALTGPDHSALRGIGSSPLA